MNYEVFISYKCSDEFGNKTPDFAIAQELYTALKNNGYQVFFPPIRLNSWEARDTKQISIPRWIPLK